MDKLIFNYSDYKLYLKDKLNYLCKNEWGYKQKAASHIGCQASYLSQIISGKPDLTLDQAHKLNQLFLHDKTETRYFILLVELGRAHSRELQNYLKEQIEEIKDARYDLKKRLQETDQVSRENMDKYYSSWLYTAAHMALALPNMQEPRALAQKLNIPEKMAAEVIEFLVSTGLVEKVKGKFEFTKMRSHLDRNSDFIQRHHINWRSQTLQSVEKNFADDLHFSTVFAISKDDFNVIKEIFIKSIESARAVIRPSEPEELYAITLDVFKVG